MSQTIAISNHKGGVGKTTTSINLGAGLHKLGQRVLLIDLDPQANLTQSLGISEPRETIYGALRESYPLPALEILPGFNLVPSTLDLSGAEIELSSEAGREYLLSELLEPIRADYNYILIDTPPSLGLLTINAFTSASSVMIPLQAQYLALQGLSKLLEVVEKIQRRLNKDLELSGVLVTQYDSRKVLNRNIAETIEEHFKGKVFSTKIRDNVALAEAPTQGLDIFRYNAKSYGAEDYLALAQEIINSNVNPVNRVI